MLRTIGAASIEDLVAKTVPGKIRQRERMPLTPALSESQYLNTSMALRPRIPCLRITSVWGTTRPKCQA